MRRLFSEYGLLAVAMICGIMGIMMFAATFFKADGNSLNTMLQTWINHLI